jgi:dolichol kinase
MQFQELQAVRRTAEQWRVGLAALTTLLSVASIIAAPGLADRLTASWRATVGGLALAGLLALLYGTLQAMRGAFGLPDGATAMTGERLRRWESEQARAGVRALQRARAATLAGITLLIATAGTTFLAAPSTASETVRIDTGETVYCGNLGTGRTDSTITVTGRDGTVHTIPTGTIKSIEMSATC